MGTYTTQMSFGALQYERLQKWMSKEGLPGESADSFVKRKFKEFLDKAIPE
jgi:hypothetical protein